MGARKWDQTGICIYWCKWKLVTGYQDSSRPDRERKVCLLRPSLVWWIHGLPACWHARGALTQRVTSCWIELGVPVASLTSVCSNGTTFFPGKEEKKKKISWTAACHLTYWKKPAITCPRKCNFSCLILFLLSPCGLQDCWTLEQWKKEKQIVQCSWN